MNDDRLNSVARICEVGAGASAFGAATLNVATGHYTVAAWAAIVVLWCVAERWQRLRAELWRQHFPRPHLIPDANEET